MAKNSGKNREDNLKPFVKGETGNPNGRPKGQRNYSSIYRDALTRIGMANGKTFDEMETMLQEVGLKHALKGNFQFYKDVIDRIYGKTPEDHNIKISMEPNERIKKLAAKLNDK